MIVTMTVKGRKRQSRGLTAVAVLVCLVIITMISGAILKVGLAQRDQVRSQERRLQAEWLAESGIQRALARLALEPDYRGESWEISAQELGSSEPALVTISVDRLVNHPARRRVRARADY